MLFRSHVRLSCGNKWSGRSGPGRTALSSHAFASSESLLLCQYYCSLTVSPSPPLRSCCFHSLLSLHMSPHASFLHVKCPQHTGPSGIWPLYATRRRLETWTRSPLSTLHSHSVSKSRRSPIGVAPVCMLALEVLMTSILACCRHSIAIQASNSRTRTSLRLVVCSEVNQTGPPVRSIRCCVHIDGQD